jgi:hypothetical protein
LQCTVASIATLLSGTESQRFVVSRGDVSRK